MKVSLSIDWDFFFDYNPYNWMYAENELFHKYIWDIRLIMQPDLITEFTPKDYSKFWSKLREKQLMPKTVYVAEHHLYAYYVLRDFSSDVVLHFDSHSDLSRRDQKIDSGNWLLQLMKLKPRLRAVWVKPDSCKGEKLPTTNEWARVRQIYWSDFENLELDEAEVLPSYVCRSAAWTPPWADKGFEDFVKESGARIIPCHGSVVNQRRIQLPIDKLKFFSNIFQSKALKLGLGTLKFGLQKSKLGSKVSKKEPVV